MGISGKGGDKRRDEGRRLLYGTLLKKRATKGRGGEIKNGRRGGRDVGMWGRKIKIRERD